MYFDHVIGDLTVTVDVDRVQKNEEQIETRQLRILKSNVFHGSLKRVVTTVDRIGGSQDRAPSVKTSVDSGLGNGDSTLFHDLVNGGPVHVCHFVKFVNADDAAIGEDHGAGLQPPLASLLISGDGSRQTHT